MTYLYLSYKADIGSHKFNNKCRFKLIIIFLRKTTDKQVFLDNTYFPNELYKPDMWSKSLIITSHRMFITPDNS